MSTICNKLVNFIKIRLVTTCHLQTYNKLSKQLVGSLWITSSDNQLATSLLTTCNRLVINKLSQDMRTHPDIGLLMTRCLYRLAATCTFKADYLPCKIWFLVTYNVLWQSVIQTLLPYASICLMQVNFGVVTMFILTHSSTI